MESNMELKNSVKIELDENQCVLDTDTTCFLCLYSTIPGQLSNEIFIKLENEEDALSQSHCQQNRVSLLSICRYLRINLKEFTTQNFPGGVPNFSVTLCNNCTNLASKLSDLCMELEVLQMKVDHCLQSFQDELEKSDMDIIRIQRLNQIQDDHVKNAELLRKKMKKQCDMKLKSTLPKIIIGGSKMSSTPSIPTSNPASHQLGIPEIAKTIIIGQNTANDDNQSNEDTPSKPVHPTKLLFARSRLRLRQDPSETCTICQPPIKIYGGRLQDHKIRTHLDVLMADSKLPNTSADDFKIYTNHVHKVETILSKKEVNSKGIPIYHCSHCTSNYASHEMLGVHLFNNHQNILAKKLVELQKSSTVEDIQSIQLPIYSQSETSEQAIKSIKCDYCQQVFSFKSALSRHKKNVCKFKTQIKAEKNQNKIMSKTLNKGDRTTCTICNENFAAHMFECHKVRVHLDFLMKEYKLPNISLENFKIYCDHTLKMEAVSSQTVKDKKGKMISYCPHCTRNYKSKEFLKIHLFSKHKSILAKQLTELQKNTRVAELKKIELPGLDLAQPRKCEKCGVVCAGRKRLYQHNKFYCEFGPMLSRNENPQYVCEICGVKCKWPSGLKLHLKNVHRGMGSTSEITGNREHEGHQEESKLHSENVKLEDDKEEEMEENSEDFVQHQVQMDVEVDDFIVKTENINDNVEVIVPDADPLQL